jgi:hypothetical protein
MTARPFCSPSRRLRLTLEFMKRSFGFLVFLFVAGMLMVPLPSRAKTASTVKPSPAFKKGMYTVVFEVGVSPTKVITKCEVLKVQDPSKAPANVVNFKVSQKYRQMACKIIADNIHDPRVVVSDPYYTYLMVDPARPDEVIPR